MPAEPVFSFERRYAGSAPHLRLVAATALGCVVAVFALVAVLAPASASAGEVLFVGLLFAWPLPLLLFAGWGLALPHLSRAQRISAATLVGARLSIELPERRVLDLEDEHAVVLSVSGTQAVIRILDDAGDVRFELERNDRPLADWVPSGEALLPLAGVGVGPVARRRAAGDALVDRVLAARARNLFEQVLAALRRREVGETQTDRVVALAGSPFDDATSADDGYRASEPRPGEPGYGALVRATGHRLGDDLAIGPAHLVVRGSDGTWHALPIDGTVAARVGRGLSFAAAGARFEVTVRAAAAEALVRWLDGRRALRSRRVDGVDLPRSTSSSST